MPRTFTVEKSSINESGGRYKSENPSSAAKKAASKLFAKSKNAKTITFSLRESTRGSEKKVYEYKATQETLAKPVVRTINGKEIVNKFKTVVVAI